MQKGRFFLWGGGAALRTAGQPYLQRFVQEAGGPGASIAILTAGSEEAAEANATYWELFEQAGVQRLISPRIDSRQQAQEESVADMVSDCGAVFIAGGAQSKLIRRLAGTALDRALRRVLNKGGIIGGTSAGTSVLGDPVILEGANVNYHLREQMIEFSAGFNLLPGNASIDTHCSSRGRFPRIIALLIERPWAQGIGIDEDTGLILNGDGIVEVLGENGAYFFDARNSASRCSVATEGRHLCMTDILLHCLRAGDHYDLVARKKLN
jgi:cyanophycinase